MSNMSLRILLILGLTSLAATADHGKIKGCKNSEKWITAEHDPNEIMKSSNKLWYFSLMGEVTLVSSEQFGKIPDDGRHWKHKRCASSWATPVAGQEMELDATMSYNDSSLYRGTFETKKGLSVGAVSKLAMYADLRIVLTDKKNWFLMVLCAYDKDPFWAVMSPHETLEPDVTKKVLDHVVKLGFTRAIEPKDSLKVRPHKIKMLPNCHGTKQGGGGVLGGLV